jgi:hypothetical protein
MKRVGLAIIGVLLVTAGGWLCIPGRNHLSEELQSSCSLAKGATVRFYEGNGGATTAFWYSVTIQDGPPWTERELFWSYSHPIVTDIICESNRLTIASAEASWSLSDADLLAPDRDPIKYFKGKPGPEFSHRGNWGPIEIARTAVGAWALAAGLLALWQSRRLPNKPLERAGFAGRSTPRR